MKLLPKHDERNANSRAFFIFNCGEAHNSNGDKFFLSSSFFLRKFKKGQNCPDKHDSTSFSFLVSD